MIDDGKLGHPFTHLQKHQVNNSKPVKAALWELQRPGKDLLQPGEFPTTGKPQSECENCWGWLFPFAPLMGGSQRIPSFSFMIKNFKKVQFVCNILTSMGAAPGTGFCLA